jgi:Kef-type K+ transport system membrane component KefB
MTNTQLALQFLLQISVILIVCRVVGAMAARFGQPQVVAEMLAGVLLGPSLMGAIAPDLQNRLFPWDPTQSTRDSQAYLYPASQLGLALYMFVVGLEFRLDLLRLHGRTTAAVALAGCAGPFVLGAASGWVVAQFPSLTRPGVGELESAMFMGACLSITAFPMLARILHHKGLLGTKLGTVAIGAGAIDDAMAWCLLAVLIALLERDPMQAAVTIGGGTALIAAATLLLRPMLRAVRPLLLRGDDLSEAGMITVLSLLAIVAWYSDRIGLHAVFGAFVFGSVVPRGAVASTLAARIQPLTVTLLLPLFFTYSGLHTRLGLLDSAQEWLCCLAILAVAMASKGVCCWCAARYSGMSNRESLGIGTLMNARGMMQLILINLGLERGIINQRLFSMLVITAIATTLLTSPLFDRFAGKNTL